MGHSRTYLLRAAGSGVTTGTAGAGATPYLAMFASSTTLQQAAAQSVGNQIIFPTGAAGTPAISFSGILSSGLWADASPTMYTAIAGLTKIAVDGSFVTIFGDDLTFRDGSGNNPAGFNRPANAVISLTGDFKISTVGTGLFLKEGANATMGVVTLSGAAGSAIVYTTKLTANTRIFLTEQNSGGTPGVIRVTSSTNLVSFTITSSSITDTSVVAWWLVQQA